MRRKINKPILLSALALTQGAGAVMLVQNSIVQAYAEQKNKEVTSQEFLDYINQLKEQNPDFKFSQGETKVFESEEQALANLTEQKQAINTAIANYKQAVADRERAYEEAKAFTKGTPSIYFDILKSIGIELVKEYRSIDKVAKKYDVEMCMAYLAKCDSSFELTTHKSKKCFELLHFMSDIHSMMNLQEYACEECLMSQLAKSWVSRKFDDSMISVVFDVFSLDTGIKTEKEQLEFIQFMKSVKEQYLTSKELMGLGYEGQVLGKALKEMKALACQGLKHGELLEIFKK